MEVRNASNPVDVKHYTTERLREEFLIQDLFAPGEVKTIYTHVDRVIVGSVVPLEEPIKLEAGEEIRADYFLQRREIGIINIGAKGTVTVDGTEYTLENKDGLYIGMGSKEIVFASADPKTPAKFYFNSTPAHGTYPTEKVDINKAEPQRLGSNLESNERTMYKCFHPNGIKTAVGDGDDHFRTRQRLEFDALPYS